MMGMVGGGDMHVDELEIGDFCWYAWDDRMDETDRRIRVVRYVRAQVTNITARRYVVKLVDFPDEWRARSVKGNKLRVT
jgi:hypothetical protein